MFPLGIINQQTLGGGGSGDSLLSGLVSWFEMEEATGQHKIDSYVNNTTNVSQFIANLTQITGKVGFGTDFPNGSSVHCQPPTGVPTGLNDWSVALWVNLNALTTDTMDHIISMTTSGVAGNANDGWHIGYRAGAEDAFDVTVRVGSVRNNANASTFGTPSTGVWYFLYAYFDATAGQCGISINNGTIDTGTVTGTPNTQTASLNIGRWGYTGGFPFYLDGKLDEIGIWNRNLTTDELTWLYNAGSGRSFSELSQVTSSLWSSIVSYYSLDEGSGTRADSKGSNNLSDNNTVTSTSGVRGNAASFLSSNSEYLDIASSPFDFNSDWTISGWMYLDSVGTATYRCVLASATATGASNTEIVLEFDDATDDKLRLYIGQGGAYINVAWDTALSATTWYHFLIYYDASATTIGISVDNGTAVENTSA